MLFRKAARHASYSNCRSCCRRNVDIEALLAVLHSAILGLVASDLILFVSVSGSVSGSVLVSAPFQSGIPKAVQSEKGI